VKRWFRTLFRRGDTHTTIGASAAPGLSPRQTKCVVESLLGALRAHGFTLVYHGATAQDASQSAKSRALDALGKALVALPGYHFSPGQIRAWLAAIANHSFNLGRIEPPEAALPLFRALTVRR
jgi:hypothetical protein